MTARWTGSRWAHVPQIHVPRTPHHCQGRDCAACGAGIEAAEWEQDYGWADHEQDMDDRAEREAS